jgi:hypothetical protein
VLHGRIGGPEEFARDIGRPLAEPRQLTDDSEAAMIDRASPDLQRVLETDIVGGALGSEQIDIRKDIRNVFHVHAMCSDEMPASGFLGSTRQVLQERLMGVDRVDDRAEFFRQHQGLAAGAATCIDDNVELPALQTL